jgi:hypothetical protein
MQKMTRILPIPNTTNGVRRVRISLPMAEPLLDNAKYFRDEDLPPLAGLDLRSPYRPRLNQTPRAPTLRAMVSWT